MYRECSDLKPKQSAQQEVCYRGMNSHLACTRLLLLQYFRSTFNNHHSCLVKKYNLVKIDFQKKSPEIPAH